MDLRCGGLERLRFAPREHLFLLAPRMGLVVDGQQLVDADLSVFLCGGQRSVTKQFLDGTQIGAAVEKVGGEGMAQGVGADVLDYPGLDQAGLQIALHAAGSKASALGIQEQGGIVSWRSPGLKVQAKGFMGLAPDRQDPFLAAFTDHSHQSLAQV